MASPVSQKLEEKLVCSICLELFRVPVTLPCGHNFCKRCISDHWHKQEQAPAGAEKGYTCPECRRAFEQHPELEKNVTLCGVVELARDGLPARRAGGSVLALTALPRQNSSEGLQSVILSKFALLRKALEDCQLQTVARIEQEQAAALGRVGEDWSLLKDRLDVLGQHRERAQRLLACPDHRTFLQVHESFHKHLKPMQAKL